MESLEQEYQKYLSENPNSTLTFEEWEMQLDEELENWSMVDYRMRDEGIGYCFEHYSEFEEIKDEEFHRLRLEFLKSVKNIREYVKSKIKSYDR